MRLNQSDGLPSDQCLKWSAISSPCSMMNTGCGVSSFSHRHAMAEPSLSLFSRLLMRSSIAFSVSLRSYGWSVNIGT